MLRRAHVVLFILVHIILTAQDFRFEQFDIGFGNPGSITVDVLNAFPGGHSYIWEGPNGFYSTDKDIFGLTVTGTYSLTVYAGQYCHIIEDFELGSWDLFEFDGNIQVTHPSSCGSNDGALRILKNTYNNGVPPYNYYWTNEQGQILSTTTDLSSGDYSFFYSDARNCLKEIIFKLRGPTQPVIEVDQLPSCPNIAKGIIDAVAIDPSGSGMTYDFAWSNGLTENGVNFSIADGLSSGTYSLTITSSTGSCSTLLDFVVEDAPDEGAFGHNLVIENSCESSPAEGSIEISTYGGFPPYEYEWDYNPPSAIEPTRRTNLETGDYCYTVTDYCNNEIQNCTTITNTINVQAQIIEGCLNAGEIHLTVSGDYPPFQYSWYTVSALGELEMNEYQPSIISLGAGNYRVKIYDNNGCEVYRDFEIRNNTSELLSYTNACDGINDGSITVRIKNPLMSKTTLTLDYNGCLSCPQILIFESEESDIQLTLNGLEGNVNYLFTNTSDDCPSPYELEHYLKEDPLTPVYTSGGWDHSHSPPAVKCSFDLFCKEDLILPDGQVQFASMRHFDCESTWLGTKKCPKTNFYCFDGSQEHIVESTRGKKRTVSVFQAHQLGEAHGIDMGVRNSFFGTNMCNRITLCSNDPLCIESRFFGEFGGTQLSFKKISNNPPCYRLVCWSLFRGVDIYQWCGLDFIADVITNQLDREKYNYGDIIEDCTEETINVGKLLSFKQELEAEFGALFTTSSLYDFIEIVENGDFPGKWCAQVSFCAEDFKFLYTDLDEVECEDFNPPCTRHYYDKNGQLQTVLIPGTCIELGIIAEDWIEVACKIDCPGHLEPCCYVINWVVLDYDQWRSNFALQRETYQVNIEYPYGKIPESRFLGFTRTKYDDSSYLFGGLVTTDSINYYVKKDPKVDYYRPLGQSIYRYQSFIDDTIVLVTIDSSYNQLNFYQGTSDTFDLRSLYSTSEIHMIETDYFNKILTIKGFYRESLIYNEQLIGASDSALHLNYYSLQIGSDGNLIKSFIKTNVEETELISTVNGPSILIENQESYSLNGTDVIVDGSVDNPIHTDFLIKVPGKTIRSIIDSSHYINEIQNFDLTEYSVEHYQSNSHNLFQSTQKVKSILVSQSSFGNVLGMTFMDTLIITGDTVISNGGEDIVFIALDSNYNVLSYKRYGSPDNERLVSLICERDIAHFGANIDGETFERQVGHQLYVKRDGLNQGVLGFVFLDDFTISNQVQQVGVGPPDNIKKDVIDIEVRPNPINEVTNIRIGVRSYENCELEKAEIYDLNGKHVLTVDLIDYNQWMTINLSNCSSGLYLLNIYCKEEILVGSKYILKQ